MANANYQISSKMNDGRIFLVAGNTYDEFRNNLNSLLGSDDAESLLTTMSASLVGAPTSMLEAAANVVAGLGATPVATPSTYAPPTGAPIGRTCKHGPMTKRSGAGAKGPWKGWMCPSPKGTPDQCDPIFVRRNEPEWNTF
jgi:hypothetical protein